MKRIILAILFALLMALPALAGGPADADRLTADALANPTALADAAMADPTALADASLVDTTSLDAIARPLDEVAHATPPVRMDPPVAEGTAPASVKPPVMKGSGPIRRNPPVAH